MAASKHNIFPISKSCGNIKGHENEKQSAQPTCCSEPFLKPNMTLPKKYVIEVWKQLVDSLSRKPYSTQIPDVSPFGHLKSVCQTLDVEISKTPVLPSVKHEEGRRGKEEGRRRKKGKWKKGKGKELTPEVTQPLQQASSTEWQSASAVNITLDPKTAHPFLKISNDRRRLRSYTYDESQTLMKTDWFERASKKYDGWPCIQAEQGFSSGQHYWEVDVRGICDWRIGVMTESATKCGFAKLNTSTGYWTLRLQLGRLVALTEPVTKLNIALPSRVVVYLDMKAGEVSFYDVNKGLKHHIYTFHVDFSNSEKCYPVFGTVDTKKELVIL